MENDNLININTFGQEQLRNNTYRLAVSAQRVDESSAPHFHILQNGTQDQNDWLHIEVSFVDLLCNDELTLIPMQDCHDGHTFKLTGRSQYVWDDYIKSGLKDFLFREINEPFKFGLFTNPLMKGIYAWNCETDYLRTINDGINIMGRYFQKNGLKVLPKYSPYLSDYK